MSSLDPYDRWSRICPFAISNYFKELEKNPHLKPDKYYCGNIDCMLSLDDKNGPDCAIITIAQALYGIKNKV